LMSSPKSIFRLRMASEPLVRPRIIGTSQTFMAELARDLKFDEEPQLGACALRTDADFCFDEENEKLYVGKGSFRKAYDFNYFHQKKYCIRLGMYANSDEQLRDFGYGDRSVFSEQEKEDWIREALINIVKDKAQFLLDHGITPTPDQVEDFDWEISRFLTVPKNHFDDFYGVHWMEISKNADKIPIYLNGIMTTEQLPKGCTTRMSWATLGNSPSYECENDESIKELIQKMIKIEKQGAITMSPLTDCSTTYQLSAIFEIKDLSKFSSFSFVNDQPGTNTTGILELMGYSD
jgi:hypothetical protein